MNHRFRSSYSFPGRSPSPTQCCVCSVLPLQHKFLGADSYLLNISDCTTLHDLQPFTTHVRNLFLQVVLASLKTLSPVTKLHLMHQLSVMQHNLFRGTGKSWRYSPALKKKKKCILTYVPHVTKHYYAALVLTLAYFLASTVFFKFARGKKKIYIYSYLYILFPLEIFAKIKLTR